MAANDAATTTAAAVLVVDDDPSMGALVAAQLKPRAVVVSTSPTEALALMATRRFDVVLTDLQMPEMSGIELCQRIAAAYPDVPVIVLTVHANLDAAISAIRAGAYDFATKPPSWDALRVAVDRATQHRALREEVRRLQTVVAARGERDDLLGESAPLRTVLDLVERVADSDATVLVTGESGTGKEVVARALHRRSRRRDAPFVAINCAAVPESLLESELFGHAKGAFTDARQARIGLFAQAHGGTLFLDEIGDMPLGLQPKLLRALQERVIRPVGASAEQPIDVRIVAATNRDLETAIEDRRFREDLYFRLNVIHIELPPLRARGGDVLILAQKFLRRYAGSARKEVVGLAPAAAERLLAYAWPGNVRELQNCIERAVALARYDHITLDDLPERVRDYRPTQLVVGGDDPSTLVSMDELERSYIARVMEAVGGNKTTAAKVLGYDRKRLYRKLERYGLAAREAK
ncbi:MAG: sigma-54 dependent transcriptional regulator [Polyangiales bacterium]